MVKCSFCGRETEAFRGLHLIKNDGIITFFCSSKCRKNTLKLGRDARKFKWTEPYKINKGKIAAKLARQEAK